MLRSIQQRACALQPSRLRVCAQSPLLLPAVAKTFASVARSEARGSEHTQEAQPGRKRPYYVPRNTNGAIPVYTDQVNTKYMTLIRNVQGDVKVCIQTYYRLLLAHPGPSLRLPLWVPTPARMPCIRTVIAASVHSSFAARSNAPSLFLFTPGSRHRSEGNTLQTRLCRGKEAQD